jgi:Mrp family chromosome partitioning ATPase
MPKDDAGPAVRSEGLPERTALSAPVLAVGLGRGSSGKSTVLAEMIWRAQAQGRSPIVADGDARSKTLSHLFADATAPLSEEIADIRAVSDQVDALRKGFSGPCRGWGEWDETMH